MGRSLGMEAPEVSKDYEKLPDTKRAPDAEPRIRRIASEEATVRARRKPVRENTR